MNKYFHRSFVWVGYLCLLAQSLYHNNLYLLRIETLLTFYYWILFFFTSIMMIPLFLFMSRNTDPIKQDHAIKFIKSLESKTVIFFRFINMSMILYVSIYLGDVSLTIAMVLCLAIHLLTIAILKFILKGKLEDEKN